MSRDMGLFLELSLIVSSANVFNMQTARSLRCLNFLVQLTLVKGLC